MANKNISKPNDMLISTLVNGEVSTMDLLLNGINAGNTQFLDPESYKETKLIKEKFTDEKGNFREDIFNEYYIKAAKLYEDLAEMNTYKKLENYIEYNAKDIFAPLDAKRKTPGYEIQKEKNPLRRTHGVDSLFEYGPQTKSMRELAQMSKIWDSEKGEWMDKTANDRGILGSLFGQSLVYATYDEDTEEIDYITGRKIKHKKGEWKLNEDGQYYTETIGNRSGYGKQFVAASDTLTKEDSALNKIDFFDSDDIEKSTVGTVMKTVAKIVPYLIPKVNLVWGGATAALEMAKVMPAFAKMVEGIAIGGDEDNETAFTRAMNSVENYFTKFDESYSDKGMNSNWSGEKMLGMLTDIFAQLYQMRAAASISKLAKKDISREALEDTYRQILPDYVQAGMQKGSGIDLNDMSTMKEIVDKVIIKHPQVAAQLEKQSKLSKALSLGYMALSSSADVYADALAGGYDRRMAGAAGLAAALGQFGIMLATSKYDLGTWFLDPKVGYSEGVQRQTMLKAVRKYYDRIKEDLSKLDTASSTEEKAGIVNKMLGKLMPKLKEAKLGVKEGTLYLRHGFKESLEEMTEEAVLDATKGIFDFLSYVGVGNEGASFGTAQDFVSGSFLERYLQSAIGGFAGGVLFEFQQKRIEPWMEEKILGKKSKPEDEVSLIQEIANGHTLDLYKAIDELAELDSDLSAIPVELGGEKINLSADGKSLTRGLSIAQVLKQYIKTLEGAMIGENANLTDDLLLKKTMRDYQAIKILKETGLDELVVSDFRKLTAEILSIKAAIDKKSEEEKEAALTFTDEDVENFDTEIRQDFDKLPKKFLEKLLKKKRTDLLKFLRGEKSEEYTFRTLVSADPEIRNALGALTKEEYTKLKYDVEYKDLSPDTGVLNKQLITKEYDDWLAITNSDEKFVRFGVDAYRRFEEMFSKSILDYSKNGYSDVRQITWKKLLSDKNLNIDSFVDGNAAYLMIKDIANTLKSQGEGKTNGYITLEDIFQLNPTVISETVERLFNNENNQLAIKVLELLGKNKEEFKLELSENLIANLQSFNVENLSGEALTGLVNGFIRAIISNYIEENPFNNLGEIQTRLLNSGLLVTDPLNESLVIIDDVEIQKDYILDNIKFDPSDVSFGLGTSLLFDYINNQDTIDGTVRLRIAKEALSNIIQNISNNEESLLNLFNGSFRLLPPYGSTLKTPRPFFTKKEVKSLIDTLNEKFDLEEYRKNPESIIEEWVRNHIEKYVEEFSPSKGYMALSFSKFKLTPEDIETNLPNFMIEQITNTFKDDKMYLYYQTIKNKEVSENPIYDTLNELDAVWTEGGAFKILEIAKSNHAALRNALKLEDYMPQGEAKIQMESAVRSLKLLKAIVQGMKEGAIKFGSPFAVNQLMQRFLEVNKLSSERKYDTINQEVAKLIKDDLSLIESLLQGYVNLAEKAFIGKVGLDPIIKKQFYQLLVQKIDEKATAFTIKDFSLLPDKEEIEKCTTPEEIALLYAHSLFTKFNEKFVTPESRKEAIQELIKNLNFDLSKISRSSKPTNLSKEIKKIDDFDLITWVATSLGADSYEFYYRYNQLFLEDSSNENVPLFSQELAALQAWAFEQDGTTIEDEQGQKNISIHDAIMKEIFSLKGKELLALPASRFFFINGGTGTGKTTVVGSILTKMFSNKLIYITAANERLINNYKANIKKHATELLKESLQSGSIEELIERFFTPENSQTVFNQVRNLIDPKVTDFNDVLTDSNGLFVVDTPVEGVNFAKLNPAAFETLLNSDIDVATLPEVILIDEATQVSLPILLILGFLSLKYNMKVILSGDSIQRGARLGMDTQAFNDLFLWKSSKLSLCIRANNNQISNNNFEFNKLLEIYELFNTETPGKIALNKLSLYINANEPSVISYYQDKEGNTFNGYKLVSNLSDPGFLEDVALIGKLNKRKTESTGKHIPVMVITKLDENSKPTNPKIISILEQNGLVRDDKREDYELFSPDDVHVKAVQGSEARYVIIDDGVLTNNAVEEPGEVLRSVYTFLSRAQYGALMVLSQDVLKNIGIRNLLDKATQKDEIPQLKDREKLVETRKSEVATILGDYSPDNVTLPEIKSIIRNGEKVYVRSDLEASEEILDVELEEIPGTENNDSFTPDELKLIDDASQENPEQFDDVLPSIDESNKKISPKDDRLKNSTQVRPSVDHLGVKRNSSNTGYIPNPSGIPLDLLGLFKGESSISDEVFTGFIKFKNAIIAAGLLSSGSFKDALIAIQTAIANDTQIALFISKAFPLINIVPTDASDRRKIASWFSKNVTIPQQYYAFGIKYNWDLDQPGSIVQKKSLNLSFKDGESALYYGIKLQLPNGDFHYISLGSMSKPTYIDSVTKKPTKIKSQALLDLYDATDKILLKSPLAVFKLDRSDFMKMPITSTLWLPKTSWIDTQGVKHKPYESVELMEKRGFTFDKDSTYLIDNQLVTLVIDGKEVTTYKIIALFVLMEETAGDINPYFQELKIPILQRIQEYTKFYVDSVRGLKLTGAYLTIGREATKQVINSHSFKRLLFLNSKQFKANDVLWDIISNVRKVSSKDAVSWKECLSKCKPWSLKRLIVDLLDYAGAFDNVDTLKKYLIGTRKYLHDNSPKGRGFDKQAIDSLIKFVWKKESISKLEFLDFLDTLKVRLLLYPFVARFCEYTMDPADNQNKWFILNVTKGVIDNPDNYLDATLSLPKTSVDRGNDIFIERGVNSKGKKLTDSYGSPILTKSEKKIDMLGKLEIKLPSNIQIKGNFDFIPVNFEKTHSSNLGIYGYELQASTLQMPDSWLLTKSEIDRIVNGELLVHVLPEEVLVEESRPAMESIVEETTAYSEEGISIIDENNVPLYDYSFELPEIEENLEMKEKPDSQPIIPDYDNSYYPFAEDYNTESTMGDEIEELPEIEELFEFIGNEFDKVRDFITSVVLKLVSKSDFGKLEMVINILEGLYLNSTLDNKYSIFTDIKILTYIINNLPSKIGENSKLSDLIDKAEWQNADAISFINGILLSTDLSNLKDIDKILKTSRTYNLDLLNLTDELKIKAKIC